MSDRARKMFGILWLLLGLGGIALVIEEAIRAGPLFMEHLISGGILLLAAVGAIISGLGLLKHWSGTRTVLRTVATIVILYCLLFLVMVGLGFGWAWPATAVLLALFSAATLWKLRHGLHHG